MKKSLEQINTFSNLPRNRSRLQIYNTTLQNIIYRNSCRLQKSFDMETRKLKINSTQSYSDQNSYLPETFFKITGGKLRPKDRGSTGLQEQSFMNNTYIRAIQYGIHLDMKLDFTLSRIFLQEMALSELEIRLH